MANGKTKYLRVERVDADEGWLGPPGLLCIPSRDVKAAFGEGYVAPNAAREFAAKLLAAAEAAEQAEIAATRSW